MIPDFRAIDYSIYKQFSPLGLRLPGRVKRSGKDLPLFISTIWVLKGGFLSIRFMNACEFFAIWQSLISRITQRIAPSLATYRCRFCRHCHSSRSPEVHGRWHYVGFT